MLVRTEAGSRPQPASAWPPRRPDAPPGAWSSGRRPTMSRSATRPGRGEDARLAHAAAEALALQTRRGDDVVRPRQQRSHRGAQPLGQAAHHGGGATGPFATPATPVAASALKSRAPSRWIGTGPAASTRAPSRPSTRCTRRRHVRVLDADERHGRLVVRRRPRGPRPRRRRAPCRRRRRRSRNWMPGVLRRGPVLVGHHVLAAPATTAVPGAHRTRNAIWLRHHAGRRRTVRPACPTRAAKASSSARTVGSSP